MSINSRQLGKAGPNHADKGWERLSLADETFSRLKKHSRATKAGYVHSAGDSEQVSDGAGARKKSFIAENTASSSGLPVENAAFREARRT